ncbi:MAG: tRNA pseudouridine(55) synthase TruB [Deltaproteobacteria bacterium]|nr:tRNA pseudouridine(55) synthase TruB [Deltaproteobacteria bacterium]MBW2660494.1 tRNA pseudouridine(55) synthase TruB [Deltaproteobacteria bacterium]
MTVPNINGVIIVDKPAGITSARVVARVKTLLNVKKVGHTGTLDPFATGVIVCCINNATKLARFLLHGNKKYKAVLQLGVETDTQDFTGNIISTCDKIEFSNKQLRMAFEKFEGAIKQLPPVYSALKHKGVPLYKLARKGKPVQKPARQIFISSINILETDLPAIRFDVSCSAGTYIRTLCSDIGKVLGCGGHLKELRRIESSGFTIKESLTLPELERLALSNKLSDHIINMTDALQNMPEHIANKALTDKIIHGNIITMLDGIDKHSENKDDFIKVLNTNKDLIAILNFKKAVNKYNYCCVFNK